MSGRDAVERLSDKLAQYYGPEVTRALFPPADDSEREVGGSAFMSDAVTPWISGGRASSPPGGDERMVMAALLVRLYEGGGHKVTVMRVRRPRVGKTCGAAGHGHFQPGRTARGEGGRAQVRRRIILEASCARGGHR